MARFLSLVLLVMSLAACSGDGGSTDLPPQVRAEAESLLQVIQKQDYAGAMALYDEGFFQRRLKEAWQKEVADIMAERGPMASYEFVRSEVSTRFSAVFYILEYNSIHEGNKRLRHTITLLWPVNGDKLLLVGHKIRPWEVQPAG